MFDQQLIDFLTWRRSYRISSISLILYSVSIEVKIFKMFIFLSNDVYFKIFTHRRFRRSVEGMCFLIILISRFIPHPPQALKMRLPGRPNFLLSFRVEAATSWVKRSIFWIKKATRQITVDESSRLGCFWGVFENFKEIVQRISFVQFATEKNINL